MVCACRASGRYLFSSYIVDMGEVPGDEDDDGSINSIL
jgi:hypothetical protein